MALIDKKAIPVGARIELQWKLSEEKLLVCDYLLFIPIVAERDIRTRDKNYENGLLRYVLGTTTLSPAPWIENDTPVREDGSIDVPKRDGMHALWDAEALGGLPVWVTWEDKAFHYNKPADLQKGEQ